MYDFSKIKEGYNITVGSLIKELEKIDENAIVCICGDSHVFLHVDKDDNIICLDNEALSDSYDEDEFDFDLISKF